MFVSKTYFARVQQFRVFRSVLWDCESTPGKASFKPYQPDSFMLHASSNLLLLSFTCSIQCVVEAHCCTCQEVLMVGVKFSLLFVHEFYFAPEESSSWLSKECACKKIPGGCCKEGGYQCIARMLLAMPMRCTEEAFWCTYNKKLIVHCSKKSCTV